MSGTQGYDHCAKCVLFANERDEARAEVARLKGENRRLATSKCNQCVAWNKVGQLEDEVERLKGHLEQTVMQLAACGVAATQDTEASRKERIDTSNTYYSDSYAQVCRVVDRYMEARAEVERLKADAERLNKLLDAAACDKCERKTVDDQRKLIKELKKVYHVAQAVLTGLNCGDVQKESALHQMLRKTQIEYREFLRKQEGGK